ncbi:unnamed protein product, partial [marine sediment metagenome]
ASHVGEDYAVLWEGSHHHELTHARDRLGQLGDGATVEDLEVVRREIDDVLASSKWRFVSELLSDEIVTWPEPLDFLITDLPPSTSNEMFSFFEQVKDLFGVIIVSQPTKISTIGLLRTVDLLRQKQIPIIGLVANQDGFLNRHSEIEYQFLSPRVDLEEVARKAGIPFLLSIPQCGDRDRLKPYFSELAGEVVGSKPVVLKERGGLTIMSNGTNKEEHEYPNIVERFGEVFQKLGIKKHEGYVDHCAKGDLENLEDVEQKLYEMGLHPSLRNQVVNFWAAEIKQP